MIWINVHLALASLRASKIRSFLTMFAVIVGVSSFVTVTATVDGLRNSVVEEINGLGGNLIQVSSGDLIEVDEDGNETVNFANQFVAGPKVTKADLATIEAEEGVRGVAPVRILEGTVSRGDRTFNSAFVVATNQNYPEALNRTIAEGQFINDEITGRFAVVGTGVVDELFAGEAAIGSRISIKDELYTIIGTMEEVDSTLGDLSAFNENNAVIVSVNSGERILGENEELVFTELNVQLEEDYDPNTFVESVEPKLLANHNGEREVTVLTQDELLELVDSLLGIIKLAGQFLSFIMLFVAAIVILLIMLIAVRERTREIGIRKSIGATNSNILVQFVTEAIVISWVGSFIGLIFGVLGGFALQRFADITPGYSLNTIIVLIVISTGVGVVAGVGPAWLAARRDPVESLRHE